MEQQSKLSRVVLILILGMLSAIVPFSIDMYLPGFPSIAAGLHSSVDAISYSLASFFVGVCLGQLIYGPLLDRFGRKGPLYVGLILYIVASIGCAFASSIEALIVLRFFQALAGCVGMVAPRAIVRDVFPVNENAKIFSLLILILSVSPIVAPTIGSYLISSFGWRYVFFVLAIVTFLIGILAIIWLSESKGPDPGFSLRPKSILSSYVKVGKDPRFYIYAVAGGISFAGLFAYLAGSPFVFMQLYGVSKQQYGWIFGLIALGLTGSSQLNNILLNRYNPEQIVKFVLSLQLSIGIVLVIGTVFNWLGLYGTIFLIFLFLSCQGFSFPNSSALAMAPFANEAGSASALLGALQMGLGSLASALVGLASPQTAVPMTVIMMGCSLMGLLILMLGRRRLGYMASPSFPN